MYKLKIVQHADIEKHDIDEIIHIKSAVWPYPYKRQIEWIEKNLKESDLHVFLLNKKKVVAYLNIIDIELIIDSSPFNALGIGNVCAIEKGKGYGIELMKQTNQFIIQEDKIGLLFCKHSLVDFYIKCGWIIIKDQKLKLSFNNKNIEALVFNDILRFHQLTFHGQAF